MTELEKFRAVNSCETREDLYVAILSLADSDGCIQGRTRKFKADDMVRDALAYFSENQWPNSMTREFGIRQQAMYIKYYT